MAASSVLPSSLGFSSFFASPPAAGVSAAGAAAATATDYSENPKNKNMN